MIALPAWLRLARIVAPILIGVILAGLLAWSQSVLSRTKLQRDQAVADVVEFRRLATNATVRAGATGERPLLSTADAKAALAGAFRDRDDARATLARIDRETKAAGVRSAASDAALARAQADNGRAYARSAPRIARLDAAKPSGGAADEGAIDKDSKAAWEAWR